MLMFGKYTVNLALSGHPQKRPKLIVNADFCSMQVVLQNVPKEHSAILSTFIKLPFVFVYFWVAA